MREPNSRRLDQRHDSFLAWRSPGYRFYAVGWIVSMIGTRIQATALAWDVYDRTGEAIALGFTALVMAVPAMVFALPAGWLGDRFNRVRLVMLSLVGMTLTSIGLAIAAWQQSPISIIYLLLFLDGTAIMLGRPARVALMPALVPKESFPNAVTWTTGLMHFTSVAGPALGGLNHQHQSAGSLLVGSSFIITVSSASPFFDIATFTACTQATVQPERPVGWYPLCAKNSDHPGDDHLRPLCCTVWRSRLPVAHFRPGYFAGRSTGFWLAPISPCGRGSSHVNSVAGFASHDASWVCIACECSGVWSSYDCVWPIDVVSAVFRHAFLHRCL